MHVLMINGSPHANGCTYTALDEVAGQLQQQGITTEIVHIGSGPIQGCTVCMACNKTGACIYASDRVNECIEKLSKADGLVVGSPVYYAGPNGGLCAFLDRLFFAVRGRRYSYKPAAEIGRAHV